MGICCIFEVEVILEMLDHFKNKVLIWTFHYKSTDIIACLVLYSWLIQLCKIPTQVHEENDKNRIDERRNRKHLKSYIVVNPMLHECSPTSNWTTAPSWGRSSDLFNNCSPLRVLPPAAALNRAPCFPSCHWKQAAAHKQWKQRLCPSISSAQTWGKSSCRGASSSGAWLSFIWLPLFPSMCRFQVRLTALLRVWTLAPLHVVPLVFTANVLAC